MFKGYREILININNIMIKKFENFNNIKKGILLNIFVSDYNDPKWADRTNILKKILEELPNIVQPSMGHSKGLALQTILGVDIKEAKLLAESILKKLDGSLIVLSEIEFENKNIPVGHMQDEGFIKQGRYFDKLAKENRKGIYII